MNCALCLDPSANHTTAQHQAQLDEQLLCTSCGQVKDNDDDERERCSECQAEYWEWRRDMYYDNLSKEEGGQG